MDNYEQISFKIEADDDGVSAADGFGCCSRYHACSNARECLIPDLDYSQNCIYRRQLEAGNIFYGKNADNYRPEVYADFMEKYSALSPKEKDALFDILHYFLVKKVGTTSALVTQLPEYTRLESQGFLRIAMYPDRIIQKATLSAMIAACGERIADANRWAKHNCSSEQEWNKRRNTQLDIGRGVKIKREEFIEWILTYSPDVAARLPQRSAEWSVSSMADVCGDQVYAANQWAKSMCPSQGIWDKRRTTKKDVGPDIKIYKDELSQWILKAEAGDIFEKLSEGICFVDIGLENRLELNEFFYDCLYREDYESSLDTHENDPRFVS